MKHTPELGPLLSVDYEFAYPNSGPKRRFYGSFMKHEISHDIDLVNFILGYSGFSAKALVDQRDRYEVAGTRNADGVTFYIRGMLSLTQQTTVEVFKLHYAWGSLTLDTRAGEVTAHFYEHATDDQLIIHVPAKSWDVRARSVMSNFAQTIMGEERNYLTVEDILMSAEVGPLLASSNAII